MKLLICVLLCLVSAQAAVKYTVLPEITMLTRQSLGVMGPEGWVDRQVWSTAYYNYGLPSYVFHLMNSFVGSAVIQADIVSLMAAQIPTQVRYLEIGVSVGKTFWVQSNQITNGLMIGLDIEYINPRLKGLFGPETVVKSWVDQDLSATAEGASLRAGATNQVTEYVGPNSNRVMYIAADEFDRNAWQALSEVGDPPNINLVLSDAMHNARALLYEWNMLTEFNVLNRTNFIMIWDDLNAGFMEQAWHQIVQMAQIQWAPIPLYSKLFMVGGWIGQHEHLHKTGILSTHNVLGLIKDTY